MSDPFKILEPTCISFSGGRTSAYMLWRVLQSNNGLPEDAVICFANTGKEEEATLRFVERCSTEWNVPITWVEFDYNEDTSKRFKVVNFETASRNEDSPRGEILAFYWICGNTDGGREHELGWHPRRRAAPRSQDCRQRPHAPGRSWRD